MMAGDSSSPRPAESVLMHTNDEWPWCTVESVGMQCRLCTYAHTHQQLIVVRIQVVTKLETNKKFSSFFCVSNKSFRAQNRSFCKLMNMVMATCKTRKSPLNSCITHQLCIIHQFFYQTSIGSQNCCLFTVWHSRSRTDEVVKTKWFIEKNINTYALTAVQHWVTRKWMISDSWLWWLKLRITSVYTMKSLTLQSILDRHCEGLV